MTQQGMSHKKNNFLTFLTNLILLQSTVCKNTPNKSYSFYAAINFFSIIYSQNSPEDRQKLINPCG